MFTKSTLFPKSGSDSTQNSATRVQRPNGAVSSSASADQSSGGRESVGLFMAGASSSQAAQNTAARTDKATPEAADVGGNQLIVGPNVKLKGAEILDCDILVVEGRVEATMDSRVIRVSENGSFSGTVGIDVAEIHGRFDGELTARSQLIIHATGRVSGKIRYGKIFIEEGGEISGDIRAIDANESRSTASTTSSLSSASAVSSAA